jgi:hypothetical protein
MPESRVNDLYIRRRISGMQKDVDGSDYQLILCRKLLHLRGRMADHLFRQIIIGLSYQGGEFYRTPVDLKLHAQKDPVDLRRLLLRKE